MTDLQNNSNSTARTADPLVHANLRGGQLLAARLIWIIFLLVDVGAYITLIPGFYTRKMLDAESVDFVHQSAQLIAAAHTGRDFLSMSVFVLTAIVIFLRRSNNKFTIFASLALIQFGMAGPTVWNAAPQGQSLLHLLSIFVQESGLVLFAAFIFLFPNGRLRSSWLKYPIFLITGLTLLWTVMPWDSPLHTTNVVDALWWDLVQIFFLFGGLALQISRYRQVANLIERQQAKWVIYSLGVFIFGLFILTLLPSIFPALVQAKTRLTLFNLGIVTALFYIPYSMIPISIGISILQYRLWDIDVLINRSLVYGTLVGVLGLFLSGGVLLLQGFLRAATGQASDLVIIFVALALGLFAQPLRLRIQNIVDHWFYRSKVDTRQAFQNLLRDVRTIVDLPDLLSALVEGLTEIMHISHGAAYLRDRGSEPRFLLQVRHQLPPDYAQFLTLDDSILNKLNQGLAVLGKDINQLLLPLIAQRSDGNELIGVLALGPRKSGRGYSFDEQFLLESLTIQAGTAIYVAQLSEIQRQKIEEVSRLKSEFLATMSHELRTPLHAIVGYTDIQLEGLLGMMPSTQSDNLEKIMTSAKHLTTLIDDVLDIAKIEAGQIEIIKQPLRLQDWLQSLVQQTRGLAIQKGLVFEDTLDENLPEIIIGDENRLMQVAINLVGNAIKFTHEGSVRIDLRWRGKHTWSFTVTDTGIGIPEESQEVIFEQFRQVDSSSRREYGGTGLGLAIVRNLVLLMGGTINLRSRPGEGSIFTLTLPLEAYDKPSTGSADEI